MNKFIFSGNLTRDPEMKYSAAGKAYTKFTVAVKRTFDRDKTDFFNCTAFGKQAENIAQYCAKGSKVLVEGQVNIDKKEDKYYTNIIADRVEFLSTNSKENTQTKPSDPNMQDKDPFAGSSIDISDSDLPF